MQFGKAASKQIFAARYFIPKGNLPVLALVLTSVQLVALSRAILFRDQGTLLHGNHMFVWILTLGKCPTAFYSDRLS